MMLLIEHPSATCPECNEPLLYGTKKEASGWKVYYECSAQCGFEETVGRIPMSDVDHHDEVDRKAEEMGERYTDD
ncbi:hypothetical protein ACOZ4N_00835 (plasmid) [Halorientalis pallida]|uniref:hypothetical protein n=1 Tax=Halorientalis pallida TaxID=2479928 RepID=UPI003C6F12BA